MIKLFITLNILLLVVVSAYILGVQGIGEALIRQPKEVHFQRLGQGTLSLLNESVKGLSAAQREARYQVLKEQFIYPLALLERDKGAFTAHELSRLEKGLIVQQAHDSADYLYGYLPETNLFWSFAVDQTKTVDERNTAAGTVYLIREALEQHPPSQQPIIMESISAQFGIEVALKSIHELSLESAHMQSLASGDIVVDVKGDDEEIYQKLANSPWVIYIGRVQIPWIGRNLNLLLVMFLGVIIALTTLFWVWTLWRDLSRIRKAAQRFGEGDYDVRVPYKKRARIAPLSHAFNTMAEQTQSSIRSHKELTGAVSHELRTPVARMRFSLDMLADSDNVADRARYVENMNVDMEELDSLLNELLTYARLDQGDGGAKRQVTPLYPWLEVTMARLQPLSGAIALTWESHDLTESDVADFDAVLMSRLLNNLVQNAVRYANTRVMVSVSKSVKGIVLCVDDDGLGIPEAERERLFEAFATQDSSRNKTTDGFGLGLAIVKRIANAHGGRVEIDDSPLGGARFCVSW